MTHRWLAVPALALVATLAHGSSLAQTPPPESPSFTVNSTDDAGDGFCGTVHCNLREAIERANSVPGQNTITFAIAGPGPHTITPDSALPAITDQVTIDALPGCTGAHQIVIEGQDAGDTDGLRILEGGAASTVRGLVIGNFSATDRAGIRLIARDNEVECTYLGVDATGEQARPNYFGLVTSNANNHFERGGVVSGNASHGVVMGGAADSVSEAFIGTDDEGESPLGNGGDGVLHTDTFLSVRSSVALSVISANGESGIDTALGLAVRGNKIGTDASGAVDLGNAQSGIEVGLGSARIEENLISGNGAAGVWLEPDSDFNFLQGNKIGTNATGTAKLPNQVGVLVNGFNNWIGVVFGPEDANLISGNGRGIEIRTAPGRLPEANGNRIVGNLIGTDASGSSNLGNSAEGVLAASSFNTIGEPGEDSNTVAFNGATGGLGHQAGVLIESGTGNDVLANAIFANAGLGIDLAPAGVTLNDPGDPDIGPNDLQNFPLLTSAESGGGRTSAQGTLHSMPDTDYRIDVYAIANCDANGFGEGRLHLRTTTAGTDSTGLAVFTVASDLELPAGQNLTATATDPNGSTSEFSACRVIEAVTRPPESPTFTVNSADDSSDGFCGTVHCTLREAIERANNVPGENMITFAIPGPGPHTIRPSVRLPTITEAVTIDALPSCAGTPQIEIDGSLAGDADGLRVNTPFGITTLRGLVVNGFDQPERAGIKSLNRDSTETECSYVGTDPTGELARPNYYGVVAHIRAMVTRGSVVSGNLSHGVVLDNFGGVGESFIGTNASGTAPLGNGGDGVHQEGCCASGFLGVGSSVVSANAESGVEASGMTVSNNKIGTDVTGAVDLGNGIAGVQTRLGSMSVHDNVISGNGFAGVWMEEFSDFTGLQANRIGTNAAGTAKIPNPVGVLVEGQRSVVGSLFSSDQGNLISGNGRGVAIRSAAGSSQEATQNRVLGNRIGTDVSGMSNLGNIAEGVLIAGPLNQVGESGSFANTIAFNGTAGIRIESGTGIRIASNSIFANGALGIDLAPTGVTTNDAGDADTGANELQNFPVVTSAQSGGARTTLRGSLQSRPDTEYRIDLYQIANCDPTGFGEGRIPLRSTTVTTGSDGTGAFAASVDSELAAGENVTATATDPNGNSSEFSACRTIEAVVRPPESPTFTVNSADDTSDGFCGTVHCNLREAIERANSVPGQNTITFAIPGPGPHTIRPSVRLPAITEEVTIDALPNCAGGHEIEIDGSLASDADGLRVTGGGVTTFRGVVVNNFASPERAGIRKLGLDTVEIECSHIGTDPTGSQARPNFYGTAGSAVHIGRQTVISGNLSDGVHGFGSVSDSFIGTDRSGTAALGNGGDGIDELFGCCRAFTGSVSHNVISANGESGVEAHGQIALFNNRIGTDKDGNADLGNATAGVEDFGGSLEVAAGNVISGNQVAGVWLRSDFGGAVHGSKIGTNAAGAAKIPNGVGVIVEARTAVIGNHFGSDEGNVISGNGRGVEIRPRSDPPGPGDLRVRVIGNRIGTDAAGTGALGNTAEGVLVSRTGTTIGEPDRPNTIAFNGTTGIRIESGTANRISSNSIFANGLLGIDLGPTGVTANDDGDADSGPNGLQNFPVITSARTSGGITTLSGTLDSRPSTDFRVEVFETANCDPSRFGEGRVQILATAVATDSSGRVSFTRSATQAAVDGHFITATATDPDGNTSEFSRCVRVNNAPPACTAVAPSRSELRPANHKLVAVTLSGATDPEGDPVQLRITGVTQDEPLTGTGDNTSPDAVLREPDTVLLRSERAPHGDGRVYRIAFEVSDGMGGMCTATGSVQVRRSSGPAIDSSPPSYNSLGP